MTKKKGPYKLTFLYLVIKYMVIKRWLKAIEFDVFNRKSGYNFFTCQLSDIDDCKGIHVNS